MFLFLLTSFSILFIFIQSWKNSGKNLPPGPPSFPFIGSLFSVLLADASRPAIAFHKLAKRYGSVFTVQLGPSFTAVVINSYNDFVKVASSDQLLSRIDENDFVLLEKANGQDVGLIFSKPEIWSETRTFTHRILRKYGFGTKAKTETIVIGQISEFCEKLKSSMTNGHVTWTVTNQFDSIFFNTVWAILTGKVCSCDGDKETRVLLDTMHAVDRSLQFGGGIGQIFPILMRTFPRWMGLEALCLLYKKWWKIYEDLVFEVRKEGVYLSNPQSFLEEFLQKVDTSEELSEKVNPGVLTEPNLIAVLQDLGVGGSDTQSYSIKFLIRFVLYYPWIQVNIQEEVDRVIGHRRVTTNDIQRLTYLQATLFELYRLSSVAPIIPRKVLGSWNYGGYKVPKGASVLLNVWSASRDESIWQNANEFSPERFLSPDGRLINTDKIVSFGLGKRRCIGEQLAKTSMVLITATLFQEFSFYCDDLTGLPVDAANHGMTLDPLPYNVVIKNRQYLIQS